MDNNESDLGLGISSVSSGQATLCKVLQNIGELNLTAPGKFRVDTKKWKYCCF